MQVSEVLATPNPENKLFVGGAPPGTDESVLQQVRHGTRPPLRRPLPAVQKLHMPALAKACHIREGAHVLMIPRFGARARDVSHRRRADICGAW